MVNAKIVFLVFFVSVLATSIFAAMPAYTEVIGPDGLIEGSVEIPGKEGTIETIGFEHEVYIPYDIETGQVQGSRRHKPLTIVKEFDKSSPLLYQALCNGQNLPRVELKWYRIYQAEEEHYFTILIEEVIITSIKPWMPNTRDPDNEHFQHMEEVSLVYRDITWTWEPTNTSSGGGGPDFIFFDIPLLTGWNLISTPLRPANTNIGTVIQDLIGQVSIWNYNAITNSWFVYNSEAPQAINTLTQMFFGRAYWLKSSLDQNLSIEGTEALDYTINLKEGWNFVGFNISTSQMPNPINDLIFPITVWTYYKDEWRVYDTTGTLPNTLNNMTAGKGYWIKSDVNQSWKI